METANGTLQLGRLAAPGASRQHQPVAGGFLFQLANAGETDPRRALGSGCREAAQNQWSIAQAAGLTLGQRLQRVVEATDPFVQPLRIF